MRSVRNRRTRIDSATNSKSIILPHPRRKFPEEGCRKFHSFVGLHFVMLNRWFWGDSNRIRASVRSNQRAAKFDIPRMLNTCRVWGWARGRYLLDKLSLVKTSYHVNIYTSLVWQIVPLTGTNRARVDRITMRACREQISSPNKRRRRFVKFYDAFEKKNVFFFYFYSYTTSDFTSIEIDAARVARLETSAVRFGVKTHLPTRF